jgi:prolyl oligopeptidase
MKARILWLGLLLCAGGRARADEFSWLEASSSPAVQAWTRAQDEAARADISAWPGREALRKRLEELMSAGGIEDAVAVRAGRVFYLKREGLENQPVLYVRMPGDERAHEVISPNRMNSSGTVSLDWWEPSNDGRYVVYGVSEKGSEDSVLRVRDVDSVLDLPDRINWTGHASVAWLPDRTGFYYTRYPKPGTVLAGEEQYHRRVYFHRLGTDILRDEFVFSPRAKEDWPDVAVSGDGRYLLITVFSGWSKSALFVKELGEGGGDFRELTRGKNFLHNGKIDGDTLFILTNEGAPRFKIVSADLKKPLEAWKTLVAESPFTVTGFDLAGRYLAVDVLERAASRLRLHERSGKVVREIPVPRLGTVKGFGGCPGCRDLFLIHESFFIPPTLYRYSLDRASMTVVDSVLPPADLSDFTSEQVVYPSKDGTPVSMFLVRQKRLKRDRAAPTLLTGYGGFGVNMTPSYSPALILWLERGGLYALPNLRGGGEYGEAWHQAGMLGRKQNVFDDFIAAARWLIEKEYTRPERLAIYGGSNGGLLMGAALTQAPELFRAVVCGVPLLDMLRYHLFLMARLWIPEYGSAEDPRQADFLAAYSPYHNIQKGTAYPAVLFLSGETDSRVHPMHARKMAARLQKEGAAGRPVLLRYDREAGHGAGKPLSKKLDELTDRYAFLFWQLAME